jgi:hypothetical protein
MRGAPSISISTTPEGLLERVGPRGDALLKLGTRRLGAQPTAEAVIILPRRTAMWALPMRRRNSIE